MRVTPCELQYSVYDIFVYDMWHLVVSHWFMDIDLTVQISGASRKSRKLRMEGTTRYDGVRLHILVL